MLRDPEVEHFFTRLIQRVAPKSYAQGACGSVVAFLGGGLMNKCMRYGSGNAFGREWRADSLIHRSDSTCMYLFIHTL